MPFVRGCDIAADCSAGDWVDIFSGLTNVPSGDPEWALLGGRNGTPAGSCELERTAPFTAGATALWVVCWPLTPA